jgi:mono/diheme cytochrome c family protein
MKGNGIVALDRPNALINTILNGIATQTFTNGQRMYAMPSFSDTMDESEIAALVSWMRAQWGGQGGHPVTGGEVKAFQRSVR